MEDKLKKCPYCGQEIMAMAKKCRHCGMWIDSDDDLMTVCPACGERVDKRSKVCPYCQEPLPEEVTSVGSATIWPGEGTPEKKEASQPELTADGDNLRRPDSIFRVHNGFGRYYSWGCFFLVFLMIFGDAVGMIDYYKSFTGTNEFGVENAGAAGHFIYALEVIPDWLATLMSDGGLLFCFAVIYSKLKKCYNPMSGQFITLIVLQAVNLLLSLTDQYMFSIVSGLAVLVMLTIVGATLRTNYDGPLKTLGTWFIIYMLVQLVGIIYIYISYSSGDLSLFFLVLLLVASLLCYDQIAKAVE